MADTLVLLSDIVAALRTYAISEMGTAAIGVSGLTVVYTETPVDTSNDTLPIMFFRTALAGSQYGLEGEAETLQGYDAQNPGAFVAGTQRWDHSLEGVILLGKVTEAADIGRYEVASRPWYTRVPQAYWHHYTLGGTVMRLRVLSGVISAETLSDGEYYALVFPMPVNTRVSVLATP